MKKVKKIPKKITILGEEYDIVPSEAKDLKKDLPIDGAVLGLCDFESKKIKVDNTLSGTVLNRVLRHECIHAFFEESGLDCQFDSACDEALVDWIALQFPKIKKAFEEMGIANDN